MAKKTSRKKNYSQRGTSTTRVDRKKKAKRPGKRKSSTGKVYYERIKNRSDKPGSLTGIVRLKKFPKRPKAKAPTKVLENYVDRCEAIERENNKRIKLAKEIQGFKK
jgi:hypothetical protein